jgi:hypothetical protein
MARIQVEPNRVSIPESTMSPIGVRFVPLGDTRELVTIRPTDPVWTSDRIVCKPGSIVRLQPPATASDADITRVKEGLTRAGAARVRVEPRATGEKVVAQKEERPAARASIREVVFGMANEARTHNREALRAELERSLSEEGI